MSAPDTLPTIVAVIVEISGIDPNAASADKHIFEDLGVDSLDFLDITFEIDRALGIRMPIEAWLTDFQADPEAGREMFVLGNFAARVDAVRAEKIRVAALHGPDT